MPKKKHKESASEQAERFRKAVEEMVAAGELNPTEAEMALDELVRGSGQSETTTPPNEGAA